MRVRVPGPVRDGSDEQALSRRASLSAMAWLGAFFAILGIALVLPGGLNTWWNVVTVSVLCVLAGLSVWRGIQLARRRRAGMPAS